MPDDTWLKEMRSVALEPDVITHSAIIYGYARYEDWNKALMLLGHVQHEGIRPTLVTHSTTAVAARRKWPWAGFVLHQMQQLATQPDIQALSTLQSTYEQSNQWTLAAHLFKTFNLRNRRP
mmetsp:Transcript_75544/g.149324  ORF Transcript_75544/g.149324 Transcript_75544/m.149324 type:complete len:121 (-) Transcript_75544:24-386(-)